MAPPEPPRLRPLPLIAIFPCGAACVVVSLHREFFIDHLLVRIHFLVEMIVVDRPCAMEV